MIIYLLNHYDLFTCNNIILFVCFNLFFSTYCMLYHYLIIYLGHLLFCLFLHGSIQIEIICFFFTFYICLRFYLLFI